MSTQWRCAVCESLNEGGETCAACGTPRTEATVPARPVPRTPLRQRPRQDEGGAEVPVRRLPIRRRVRQIPDGDRYGLDDYFNVDERAARDDSDVMPEDYEFRPRVRVIGCCLPLSLGMLLVFAGAVTVLADLVIRAL